MSLRMPQKIAIVASVVVGTFILFFPRTSNAQVNVGVTPNPTPGTGGSIPVKPGYLDPTVVDGFGVPNNIPHCDNN